MDGLTQRHKGTRKRKISCNCSGMPTGLSLRGFLGAAHHLKGQKLVNIKPALNDSNSSQWATRRNEKDWVSFCAARCLSLSDSINWPSLDINLYRSKARMLLPSLVCEQSAEKNILAPLTTGYLFAGPPAPGKLGRFVPGKTGSVAGLVRSRLIFASNVAFAAASSRSIKSI